LTRLIGNYEMEELLIPLYSEKQINMARDDLQEAEKIRKDID
jgi:hypothetical protein